VPESYDPLFAKLIVRGSDRQDALATLRRALAEFRVEGISTTLPFFRALLDDEVFVSGNYTTGFVAERMAGLKLEATPTGEAGESLEKSVREVEVEVDGKLFRVKVFSDDGAEKQSGPPRRKRGESQRPSASEGTVSAPMQGTIVGVLVGEGQEVAVDEPVCILEAMKMESEIRAQKTGTVSKIRVEPGQTVRPGDPLVVIE
jgi:acetyl-CoA/propionyl-CoA carboxylase biotin carboxyl carrier protein